MKGIIIYNTKSSNTELLGNEMKKILERDEHEIVIKRDKEINSEFIFKKDVRNP